jgi:hypothetical protein
LSRETLMPLQIRSAASDHEWRRSTGRTPSAYSRPASCWKNCSVVSVAEPVTAQLLRQARRRCFPERLERTDPVRVRVIPRAAP